MLLKAEQKNNDNNRKHPEGYILLWRIFFFDFCFVAFFLPWVRGRISLRYGVELEEKEQSRESCYY